MRVLLLAFAVGIGGLAPLCAHAQPTARQKAEIAYREGREAFLARDCEAALARFKHAYLLDNSTTPLFNIARACEELGRRDEAIYYYQLYLDRDPNASDRQDVEQRIRRLKAEAAPNPAPEAAAPTEQEPVQQAHVVESGLSLGRWAYAAWGLGAASAGVALYFGLDAAQQEEDHASASTEAEKARTRDDGEQSQLMSNVFWGTAGALIITGTVLFFLEPDAESGIAVGPTGATWQVRF
jgi:tetratricopeptide (TPR) repeat protein